MLRIESLSGVSDNSFKHSKIKHSGFEQFTITGTELKQSTKLVSMVPSSSLAQKSTQLSPAVNSSHGDRSVWHLVS